MKIDHKKKTKKEGNKKGKKAKIKDTTQVNLTTSDQSLLKLFNHHLQ